MIRFFLSIFISLFVATVSYAQDNAKPLPAEKAFAFSSSINQKNQLVLAWNIAPDYYLYRDKIKVIDPTDTVKIAKLDLPKGHQKSDELNGTYQVYMGDLTIPVTFTGPAKGIVNLTVKYQGCSAHGFCYPPFTKDIRVDLSKVATGNVVVTSLMEPQAPVMEAKVTDQNYAQSVLQNANYLVIILSFLGLGLLLAFTPCVLPMIPILSGIIVGQGKNTTAAKSFFLSFIYVLGMALTYAVAGMIVAMIGGGIQVFFQKTWVIVLFSALFVLLALSLFGYYELQLPRRWQNKLTHISNRQKGGTYLGVFFMGSLSSLIVSPCVSAPLVGVLAYIAQTGDMMLGGLALLALGFGMGLPLLVIGVSAGKLLPKAGAWMESIKKICGLLLLGCAAWILQRVIPASFVLYLWASLLIFCALFMGVLTPSPGKFNFLVRGFGQVFLIYGVILVIGAVLGNTNPLRPWEKTTLLTNASSFDVLKDMGQLDSKLMTAKKTGKPIMLDFYADWYTSCVEIDRHVFNQPQVQHALSQFVLLRADVTNNNKFDQALLKTFHVIAPPTILFFDQAGHELKEQRIVGAVNVNEFLNRLQKLDLVN